MPELDTPTLTRITTKIFSGESSFAAESAIYSIDDLLHTFETLRGRMFKLIDGLTPEQLNYNPDRLSYSLSEVISHMVAAQGGIYNAFIDLTASVLSHIDPVPRGAGAGAEKGLTWEMLQARLSNATNSLITIIRTTYDPNNTELIQFQQFGRIPYKGLLLFQVIHDLDHLTQAQTVRRTPTFPRKAVSTGST